MKIGLVPQVSINASRPEMSVPYVPLGVLCLAGALNRRRHDIEVVDLTLLVRKGKLRYDGNFDGSAAALIASKEFDLVGFSSFSSCFHHTIKIASELKKAVPGTMVVFGGPQASFCHKEVLRNFPVDIVVRGEGEETFRELIDALENVRALDGIRGISYKNNGNIMINPDRGPIPDLNLLPLPAYELYPISQDTKFPIEMTRGCPFRCVYCSTSNYWGRNVRRKSVERALAEIKLLKNTFGARLFSFADDTFTVNRKETARFCREIINDDLRFEWYCSSRIDMVDGPLLKLMSKAGCSGIFYGIESGSPRIQKLIRKNIKLASVIKNLKLTSKSGINIAASLMIGFPDETENDLLLTLKLIDRIKRTYGTRQNIQLHLLSPDIDTKITSDNMDVLDYDGSHSDHVGGVYSPFDSKMILKYKKMFISYYYIKMKHIERKFISLLGSFTLAANAFVYWSCLYANARERTPLGLFRKWLRDFEKNGPLKDLQMDVPESMKMDASVLHFFWEYFERGKGIPASIRELFKHESIILRFKGALALDPELMAKAKTGGTFFAETYCYDPLATIGAIRRSIRAVGALKKTPVTLEYFLDGLDDTGPVIGFRR